jgi:hypothetical protein
MSGRRRPPKAGVLPFNAPCFPHKLKIGYGAPPPDERTCRIYLRRAADFFKTEEWPRQREWPRTNPETFRKVFAPRVKRLENSDQETAVAHVSKDKSRGSVIKKQAAVGQNSNVPLRQMCLTMNIDVLSIVKHICRKGTIKVSADIESLCRRIRCKATGHAHIASLHPPGGKAGTLADRLGLCSDGAGAYDFLARAALPQGHKSSGEPRSNCQNHICLAKAELGHRASN